MYIDQSRTHRHLVASAYARLNNNGKQRKIVKKKKKKYKYGRSRDRKISAIQRRNAEFCLSLLGFFSFLLLCQRYDVYFIFYRAIFLFLPRAQHSNVSNDFPLFCLLFFSSSRYFENFFSLIIYFILDTRSFPVQEYNNK